MPHVLTLYYLLTLSLSVHPYTLPQRPYPLHFLEHVLYRTYSSLLQICLLFIIFNYCVIATQGSATMHCHCFLRVIDEA